MDDFFHNKSSLYVVNGKLTNSLILLSTTEENRTYRMINTHSFSLLPFFDLVDFRGVQIKQQIFSTFISAASLQVSLKIIFATDLIC